MNVNLTPELEKLVREKKVGGDGQERPVGRPEKRPVVRSILPWTPARQWVLSLPHRIRYRCGYDPELCRGVRTIFVRAISSFYKTRAKRAGIANSPPDPAILAQAGRIAGRR